MLHFIVTTEVNVFFSETEKCGTDIQVYEFSFAQGRVCVCVCVCVRICSVTLGLKHKHIRGHPLP